MRRLPLLVAIPFLLAVLPASAQLPQMPDAQDLTARSHRLWVHLVDWPSCILAPSPDGEEPAFADRDFYLHTDPNEHCGSLLSEPRRIHNVANGNPYGIHLNPALTDPVRLDDAGAAVVDLWIAHRTPAPFAPAWPNAMNVDVTLHIGSANVSTGWTGVASVAALLDGQAWYHFVFELPVPADTIPVSGKGVVLEVRQNACPAFLVGAEDILPCLLAEGPMPNSVGYQWYVGYTGEHRSFVDLPVRAGRGA